MALGSQRCSKIFITNAFYIVELSKQQAVEDPSCFNNLPTLKTFDFRNLTLTYSVRGVNAVFVGSDQADAKHVSLCPQPVGAAKYDIPPFIILALQTEVQSRAGKAPSVSFQTPSTCSATTLPHIISRHQGSCRLYVVLPHAISTVRVIIILCHTSFVTCISAFLPLCQTLPEVYTWQLLQVC